MVSLTCNVTAITGRVMATQWFRGWGTEVHWATGHVLMASLPSAHTVERIHFGIRWQGITSNVNNFENLSQDFIAFGVVTQASFNGPTPPNALTHAEDVNPPMERWLWWGTAHMQPLVFGSAHPDITIWGTDATALVVDSQGRVKANVAAGQTLDVYITWAPWSTTEWADAGPLVGQYWYSLLTSS